MLHWLMTPTSPWHSAAETGASAKSERQHCQIMQEKILNLLVIKIRQMFKY